MEDTSGSLVGVAGFETLVCHLEETDTRGDDPTFSTQPDVCLCLEPGFTNNSRLFYPPGPHLIFICQLSVLMGNKWELHTEQG